MTPRARLVPLVGALALVVVLAASLFFVGGTGCASREAVEARVAAASSALQQAAAQGKIKIEDLAAGIKRLNDGATAYNTTQDHRAYCDALDKIGDEFKLDN